MPRRARPHDGDPAVTVLVADAQQLFARRLVAALNEADGVAVVANTSDAAGAVRRASVIRPDVALVDRNLVAASGEPAAAAVVQASPDTHVVLLVDIAESADQFDRSDVERIVEMVKALAA